MTSDGRNGSIHSRVSGAPRRPSFSENDQESREPLPKPESDSSGNVFGKTDNIKIDDFDKIKSPSFAQMHISRRFNEVDLRFWESQLSPISAVCHTYTLLYFITYKDFRKILRLDPLTCQLFRTIASIRSKNHARYNDKKLCKKCVTTVEKQANQLPFENELFNDHEN